MANNDLASRLPLLFYYHRLNRYSFNALAGALDIHAGLSGLPIGLPRNREELKSCSEEQLRRHGRVILGISVLTCQFEGLRELLVQLRSAYGRRIIVVAGGPHATADARSVLAAGADVVLRGEAEAAFPALLERFRDGRELDDLAGAAFRRNGETHIGSPAPPADLEKFPSFSPGRKMFGPVEITRGCAFACRYCQTSSIFGTRLRHRSVPCIVEQAAGLRSRNRRVVRLLSPNAFSYGSTDGIELNLAAMTELLAALRGLLASEGRIIFGYFPSEVRPEHVTHETLELLRRYADNDEIVIGAQSGSQRVLDACHRSHHVETVLAAVSLARRFGYKIIVDFIFGLPGESERDVRESISVMQELSRLGARIHPHLFSPLPQTEFAAQPPGTISPDLLRALEFLSRKGAIYGGCPPEQ